jgi:AcrR family transcriptional regulator
MAATTERRTAQERREEIVEAAFAEFAQKGLHGTSTDVIARRAGVSQPYLFRLFGTKKELFIAALNRCFRVTLETFMRAAEGKQGEDALIAMGTAYGDLVADRTKLLMQMQGHVACGDPEICEVVRRGFGEIVEYIERVSGARPERVRDFIAMGMLCNVASAMDLPHSEAGWAKRLLGAAAEVR